MARTNAALAMAEPAIPQPQRTPERQRLADAIDSVRRLEAEVAEAGAAKAEAEEAQHSAWRARDDAEEVLRQARPREALSFTPGPTPPGALWGGTYNTAEEAERARRAAERPLVSIADAKAALAAATDAYDSAKRAVQHHGERITRASDRLSWSRSSIESAARAVLRAEPATFALAMECRRLATRAEAARQAFGLILHGDVVQPGSPFYGWDRAADARDGTPEARADWSVSRDWRAALEALASDPDATLPGAPS